MVLLAIGSMTGNSTPVLNFIPDSLRWLDLGLGGGLAAILLAAVAAILISPVNRDIRILFFPLLLGWSAVGLYPGMAPLIIGGIIFVHAAMGSEALGRAVRAVPSAFMDSASMAASQTTDRLLGTSRAKQEAFTALKQSKAIEETTQYNTLQEAALRRDASWNKLNKELNPGAPRDRVHVTVAPAPTQGIPMRPVKYLPEWTDKDLGIYADNIKI